MTKTHTFGGDLTFPILRDLAEIYESQIVIDTTRRMRNKVIATGRVVSGMFEGRTAILHLPIHSRRENRRALKRKLKRTAR